MNIAKKNSYDYFYTINEIEEMEKTNVRFRLCFLGLLLMISILLIIFLFSPISI
jgi:hypothetical protein